MRRAVVVLALLVAIGALVYATTAPAGQQAVTPKQFAALQKRVKNLETVVNVCFQGAVPVARFQGYDAKDANGAQISTTALDVTDQGETPAAFLLDVGQACASALSGQLHTLRIAPTHR
jgi:hypothetical protein